MCPKNYTMPPRHGFGSWCAIIPFAVAAAIFFVRAVRNSPEAGSATVYVAPRPEIYEPAQAPDHADMLADVYPSQESAITALARKVPSAIIQIQSNPQSIVVTCADDAFEARRIRNLLSRDFPSANITDKADVIDDDNAVKLNVQISNDSAAKSHRPKPAKVQISIEGPVDRATLSTTFIDRPWAADPSGYMNDHPDRITIIGHCGKVAMSEPEARHAAEEDVVRQAAILVQQHELNRGRHFNGDSVYLVSDVRRTLPIKDRFVQKFHRPYGEVWSESVLVDASSGWLESMSQRHAVAMYQHETRAKRTAASAFIVLITILIAYLFLNAVTKSYFTARLRFFAILFAVGVMVTAMGIISRA